MRRLIGVCSVTVLLALGAPGSVLAQGGLLWPLIKTSNAKVAVKNPCGPKNPCAVKANAEGGKMAENPCAAKNPCSAKSGPTNPKN